MLVPVLIVAGFLGAGKTSALRQLIGRGNGRRLGVIVNDFAALNIDADLVRSVHSDVVALENGCVCCSLRGELPDAIARLIDNADLDAIYVETSGVSMPQQIVASLAANPIARRVRVIGVYCMVDSHAFGELSYADTEMAIDQAAGADLVVLNKRDLASAQQMQATRDTIASACPSATFVTASDGLPDDPSLLDFDVFTRSSHHPSPGPARVHGEFASFTWKSHESLTLAQVRQRIQAVPTDVLRAKGLFLPSDRPDALAVFNKVGSRATLDLVDRPAGQRGVHQLVAIAHQELLDAAQLDRLFPPALYLVAA